MGYAYYSKISADDMAALIARSRRRVRSPRERSD
jgi:hypothetical protein